jgi:hypothetical protein
LKSPARSALTEGLDSLTFVLIHPKVHLGIGAVQGVRRLRKVSLVNLSRVLKDYCCRCAQSRKVLRYLEISEGCCKECVKGPSLRLEVEKISGGVKPLKTLKDI